MNYFYSDGVLVNSLELPRPKSKEDRYVANELKRFVEDMTGNQMTELETALRYMYRAGQSDAIFAKIN